MSVLVTSMVIADEDGTLLEDCCSLCYQDTPWLVSWRCHDHLVQCCLPCAKSIAQAALVLIEQQKDSRA